MVAALLALGASPPGDEVDAETALVEGNRRFREGDLEGALQAYAAGYAGSGANPVLAYNLGVAAHRLDRLPEAVLWYRRAQSFMRRDPWLQDNLELARSALGAPERPRPAWAGWVDRRLLLLLSGALLAWSLPFLASHAGRRRWLIALVAVLSLLSFTAGLLFGRIGPRAAVLLADCPGPGAGSGLPAGTEVWVRRDGPDWRVLGEPEGPVCPDETMALVETGPP
jgi:hypothetical protein